jgi:uncharacterized membrane protein (UPF0127 family)
MTPAEQHKGKKEEINKGNLSMRRNYFLVPGFYCTPGKEILHCKSGTRLYNSIPRWLIPYYVLAFCFILLSCFSAAGAEDDTPVWDGTRSILIQRGTEQIAVFNAEIVADGEAMRQGLSDRSSMSSAHGMLFILDSSVKHFFWMQGMEFPIDILFFDEDKNLTEVLPNFMPCKICLSHKAPVHTAYALEINAGLAEAFGIKTGDRFVYKNKQEEAHYQEHRTNGF